jgi:hypothetical protein
MTTKLGFSRLLPILQCRQGCWILLQQCELSELDLINNIITISNSVVVANHQIERIAQAQVS